MSHDALTKTQEKTHSISHAADDQSNELRARMAVVEPTCLRTKTSSMAVIQHSAGSYHFTAEGRKLMDFTSGVLVSNLGHNPRRWWQRMVDYLGLETLASTSAGAAADDTPLDGFCKAVPLTTYNATTPIEVLACERLLASLRAEPGGSRMEQVLWAASGSEAVQKALWAAISRRENSDIMLATRQGFHGKKGLSGAVTGSEDDPERDPRVRFISFPTAECKSVAHRQESIDLTRYAEELESLASEFGDRLCCLITEPYLGGGGSFHPQPEYLQLLEQFCRKQDILFILDEVQANFGRTGSMYAFTTYGVEPDIVLLGKGMGNGIPVDAAVGRADVFAQLAYGEGSDTWSGHPLGCAAVLATLDEFESEDIVARSRTLAAVLEQGLLRLTELPAISAVRGEGTVWGVECQSVGESTANDVASAVVAACYRGDKSGRAIHLLGPLAGCVLRVAPPLVLDPNEARDYLEAMYDIIASLSNSLVKADD